MTFFGCNVSIVMPLKCDSMGNQECKIRPQITNINGNEPLFYSYSILSSKYRCTDVVKNMNVRVFNLMSRSNETRHI